MSRELKFRVYIPDFGKMVYFDLGCFDYSDRYLYQDKYPVQQYTGLTDKNGKEIYEGDILQFSDIDKGDEPAEVIYEYGMFGCNIIDVDKNTDFWQIHYITAKLNPVIIGNVFEHSELLK